MEKCTIQTSSLEDQRTHTVTASFSGILHLGYIRDQNGLPPQCTELILCICSLCLSSLFGEPQNKTSFKVVSKTIRIFSFPPAQVVWGCVCQELLSGPQNPVCIQSSFMLRYKFGLDASLDKFKPLMNHKTPASAIYFQINCFGNG